MRARPSGLTIFACDLEMYALLLKLRLPLITAAITVCIVLYLVHVHRDLVAHQLRLKTLEDKLATLGNMIGCCPVPAAPAQKATSSTQTQNVVQQTIPITPASSPTRQVDHVEEVEVEDDDDTSSLVSDEIRDMNFMLDLIEEAQAEAKSEVYETVVAAAAPTEVELEVELETTDVKKDKEIEFKTAYTDEDFKTLEYNSLKTIAKHMGLTAKGTRDVLIQRIKEAQHVVDEA
jgi:hypothetical protein